MLIFNMINKCSIGKYSTENKYVTVVERKKVVVVLWYNMLHTMVQSNPQLLFILQML